VKIEKLRIGKGRSQESADGKSWERIYFEVEVGIEDMAELETVKANALGLLDGWLSQPGKPAKPTVTPNIFPKDLAELLTFEYTHECTIIRPRQYLGHENFRKIVAIVRDHGGEYVSAGKNSHFRLPKKT
jgi:hypothetical protein